MITRISIAVILWANCTIIYAENRYVIGKIIGADDGQPIIGAAIVNGDGNGLITDYNGIFHFPTKGLPKRVEISYIGYKNKSIVIENKTDTIIVYLEVDPIELGEVVITKKRRLSKDQLSWMLHSKIVANIDRNNPDNIRPISHNDYQRTSIFQIKENKEAKRDTTKAKLKTVPFMVAEKLVYCERNQKNTEDKEEEIFSKSNYLFEGISPFIERTLEEQLVIDMNFY